MDIISKQTYSRRKFFSFGGALGAATSIPQKSLVVQNKSFHLNSTDLEEDMIFMSATKLAELIRRKKLSSEELVKAYIERIEAVNYRLNAVVMECFDRALKEAKAADLAMKKGNNLGVLHGVPMTIKDSFETEGVVSTGGTLGRLN